MSPLLLVFPASPLLMYPDGSGQLAVKLSPKKITFGGTLGQMKRTKSTQTGELISGFMTAFRGLFFRVLLLASNQTLNLTRRDVIKQREIDQGLNRMCGSLLLVWQTAS